MGRMTSARQNNCEMEFLLRPAPGARLPAPFEDRADLEEPDIPIPHAPVVLDPPDQPRKQATSEMSFFGRERIQDRHGIGPVCRTQRERSGFEQAAPARDELLPNASQRA